MSLTNSGLVFWGTEKYKVHTTQVIHDQFIVASLLYDFSAF